MGWGFPFPIFDVRGSQTQTITTFVSASTQFWQHIDKPHQGWDVQKLHFCLDVSMQTATVLEHQMSLIIFDTYLGSQGMEDISEL